MDRLIKLALCALCSLVLHLAPASASPSEVSQYLIQTPVSMMTYGAGKLESMLSDERNTKLIGVTSVSVKYEYDTDRITIMPICFNCGLEVTEKACGEIINKMRGLALVFGGKANPFNEGASMFARFFEQGGYRLKNEPKDMRQQIDKIIFVQAFLQQNAVPDATPEDNPVKLIECEAPLLGTGYSVKRPESRLGRAAG